MTTARRWLKCSLAVIAAAGISLPAQAQASPVTITGEFTSFTSWMFDPAQFMTARVNGTPLTSSGTVVGTSGALNYYLSNPVFLAPGTTSLAFGYDPIIFAPPDPPQTFIQNGFRYLPPAGSDVNVGDVFPLGLFEFTNGQWFFQLDIGFTLTSHSSDAALAGHTFTGTLRLISNSTSGADPEAEADFFWFLQRPDLGSCRVYDLLFQPPANPGNVGTCALDGRIGSLIPTLMYSADGGAFTNPSTSGPLDPGASVPEPATLLLLGSGLAAIARRSGVNRGRISNTARGSRATTPQARVR